MAKSANPVTFEAVAALYEALLRAWNERDARVFASLFTRNGTAVGFDGSEMTGPGEMESQLGAIFTNHPTAAYVARVREIRTLGDGTWLLRGVAGMLPPGKTELMPERNAIQVLLVVPEGDTKRIAHFQNTPAKLDGRPELVKAMTEELTKVLQRGVLVQRS